MRPRPATPNGIRLAFRLCLARDAEPKETRTLPTLLDQERAELGADSHDGGSESQRTAWTTVARVLLNLDEFITRE